ncbi:ABC transporter permease [Pseudomonas sp. 148P]|uniref:ABC transporter permease n=1 Tax=Pseudomonas ulcerans TaxID=3115852 RepID=A0ABU7I1H5_9PSED|nr:MULTISPECIES: ABC transporter permease [unclassified Pseudomonas]MEE1926424.1 ABC transporter permease [Pseudomonas sp. 147P]MEE1937671.1 ABC transporter permease [Pseudomonas sp. 148P]
MTTSLPWRLAQALLVLWAAFSLSFAILYALPGDPVAILLAQSGEPGMADPAQVAELRARYHLDGSLWQQYGGALWRLAQLDLGLSLQTGKPVAQALAAALPATLALAFAALLIAVPLGVGVALAAHQVRRRPLQAALHNAPALVVSLPTFWVGLLLLQLFSFHLHWLPAMGDHGIASLVLPAVTLALPCAAMIAQVLGRSIASVSQQPFVQALRSKGVGRWRLLTRHILHNAAIPLLSLTGTLLGNLLAGAVVTETVFSRDGVGRLAQAAVASQDIAVVQGVVLLAAALYVLTNLFTDLLYPLLDPRIRQGSRP